jgi:hypothetical protein
MNIFMKIYFLINSFVNSLFIKKSNCEENNNEFDEYDFISLIDNKIII